MPFDFRRIQGPESSEDYRQFAKKKEKRKLLRENGLRTDGRSCEDIRKICKF
jgi:exosome complex RNA-binding protein Rrp42 (RNase PH superfamily)